jgi:hypothetical protein
VTAPDVLRAVEGQRGPYAAAVRRALRGLQPWPAKGEPGAPAGHSFGRDTACWLAARLPLDADPRIVEEVVFEATGSMAALRDAIVRRGGTPREMPGWFGSLYASAQDVVAAEHDDEDVEIDERTGKPVPIPTRQWYEHWRERRDVAYAPETRGATLDGEPVPTEHVLRQLRLDAAERGRKEGAQAWTDVHESWLFAARSEHLTSTLASLRHDPLIDPDFAQLRALAAVASGRDGEPDPSELAGWHHWIWAAKRRWLGLPVERHLWLHLCGEQGSGKSTLVRRLLSPFEPLTLESKSVATVQDSRCAFTFKENLVVFFDEMSRARGTEPEAIKAVVSGDHVDSRAMYTRIVERVHIRCAFVSCSNPPMSELVRDETGNRRFFEVRTPRRLDFAAVNEIDALALWRSVDEHGPPPLATGTETLASFEGRQREDRYLGPVEAWIDDVLEDVSGSQGPNLSFVSTEALYRHADAWWTRAGYRGSAEAWKVPALPSFGRHISAAFPRAQSVRLRRGEDGRRVRGYWVRWREGKEPGSNVVPALGRRQPRGQA